MLFPPQQIPKNFVPFKSSRTKLFLNSRLNFSPSLVVDLLHLLFLHLSIVFYRILPLLPHLLQCLQLLNFWQHYFSSYTVWVEQNCTWQSVYHLAFKILFFSKLVVVRFLGITNLISSTILVVGHVPIKYNKVYFIDKLYYLTALRFDTRLHPFQVAIFIVRQGKRL